MALARQLYLISPKQLSTATAAFTMPAKAVTAAYEDIPASTCAVTVNNGPGSGEYAEGVSVTITADAPASGRIFDKWTTSSGGMSIHPI